MANQQAFIGALLPSVMEASKRTGIDPRIILGQAAIETGWGEHAPGNNYFGIKSHGQGGGQNLSTTEVVNGKPVTVTDSFRGYASPGDSVKGYADFLTSNPRYQSLLNADGMDAELQALGKSGYATDPNYAQKVGAIARGINLPSAAPPLDDPVEVASLPAHPAIGGMTPQQPAQARSIPPVVLDAANGAETSNERSSSDFLALLGSMAPQQQQAPAPVQIMGPSPEQANALSSLVAALMQNRMA